MTAAPEIAPAKLNLALHVRGRLPDGRHAIETLFAFCTDGDLLSAENGRSGLLVEGPFAQDLDPDDPEDNPKPNLILLAVRRLQKVAGVSRQTGFTLQKNIPVASGLGGGSADAAAALRLCTSVWGIDPRYAQEVAPGLGSDVPACLLSLSARGDGAGDRLTYVELPELSGTPVLLINPRVPLSTAAVFSGWDGVDRGPLGDWREGRNDLEPAAIALVPQVEAVLAWLGLQRGVTFSRMSGSGATCFALFEDAAARDEAANAVPREWWRLATELR